MTELKQGVQYYSQGDFFIYIEDVPSMPEFAVVKEGGDDGYITVVRKQDLIPQEESWQWQQKQKYADQMEARTRTIQENLDELAEKVVDKALKNLSSRIKFNVAFGKGGTAAYAVLSITEELEKMIRESGKKIAGKEDLDI